jgi:hypothetical protein
VAGRTALNYGVLSITRGQGEANAELSRTKSKTRCSMASRGDKAKASTAVLRWAFEKPVGGDMLRVVGEIKGNTTYVITAFCVGR